MGELINIFNESLRTGFIDKDTESELLYQPKLLLNSKEPRKKVLSSLLWEFQTCESFFISVAFVTTAGVATIINELKEAEERNIKGKIVVSQYLDFTQPEALKRLRQFKNIELRISTNVNAHSKGYLFKKESHYNLIVGSSNLTQDALSRNKEWNLQVSAFENSKIIHKVKDEFEKDFASATIVTEKFITEYEKIYNRKRITFSNVERKVNLDKVFEPNKMQIEALSQLTILRANQKAKALIISATGTGKTYLGAFDARAFNPQKLLFVVHRLNIARKAMETFSQVFGDIKTMGIYSGKRREIENDFLFSTVQTISKEDHLLLFDKKHFDYIIIDESHRSGAQSYLNLINYFSPKFLLGMTATPERTDGNDIFKLFDYNIAYEIRLNRAMEEEMLCPFHYYGVTDLSIDEKEQDDVKIFNKLTSDERVNKIISKSRFYGTDNGITRGLIFVSKVKEAEVLSKKFNENGLKTIALSGIHSNDERSVAIDRLESENEAERLDYIFTVDIFNEGIDIPKVNQIIMLRPTESAIVFVQQLGRGLRKIDSKSYLTVIDFIGNHTNNYLIPIALYGDTSFNKDTLRKLLSTGSTEIPGVSTINFDKIAKEKIFSAIDSVNMRYVKDLKKDYDLLKFRLGRTPMMMDFIKNGSRDPFHYVQYSRSYFNFAMKMHDELNSVLSPRQEKLLELFSKEINNSKRVEDSLILKLLIENGSFIVDDFEKLIFETYGYHITDKKINSCISNLNFEFIREKKGGKLLPVNEIYNLDILKIEGDRFVFLREFVSQLENATFKDFLLDSTLYSIAKFDEFYKNEYWQNGFVLYRKYSRKDVFRILNVPVNPVAQNVGGYLVSPDNNHCPIFSTLHKEDDISESTKYEDKFISNSIFQYMSKNNRRKTSRDVQSILGFNGPIRLPLFIKKSDDEGDDFYYMGEVNPILDKVEDSSMKNDSGKQIPVVKILFSLESTVENSVFEYLHQVGFKEVNNAEQNKSNFKVQVNSRIDIDSKFKIPLYDLYAAAGTFSEMQTSKEFSLIEVPERFHKEGFFAFKIHGESMNRRIPNGSICIFKHPVVGSRIGKILLIEYYDRQDVDLSSHFTIKTYTSSKFVTEEGWRHETILLKPNSYDPAYEDIIVSMEDVENNVFNVVGEFVDVLT